MFKKHTHMSSVSEFECEIGSIIGKLNEWWVKVIKGK